MKLQSMFIVLLLVRSALSYIDYGGVEPSAYDITINPYILPPDEDKIGTFAGSVKMSIYCNSREVKQFSLDSHGLNYTSVDIYREDSEEINVIPFGVVYEEDRITFQLEKELAFATDYILEFTYTGIMGMDKALKYDTVFNIETKKERKWVWLQGDVSGVFPCFLDPRYRAKFLIHIGITSQCESRSNGRLYHLSNTLQDMKHKTNTFERTPPIPAYMVEIFLSTRDYETPKGYSHLRVFNVYPVNYTKEAGEAFHKIRQAYESIIGIDYASLGIHHEFNIAHPSLYRDQYIQYWGFGIFEEEMILTVPSIDNLLDRERMRVKLSAAMSQNWFGNALSPVDTKNAWVKRALTKFYEHIGTDQIYPEYNMEVRFVVEDMMPIMWLENNDFHLSYNSDEFFPKDDNETMINSWLTTKAAAIIRMYRYALTPTVFRNAMKQFIKTK